MLLRADHPISHPTTLTGWILEETLGKKWLQPGRLSWRFRSLASPTSISMGQQVLRAPPLLQPSNPSRAWRRRVALC